MSEKIYEDSNYRFTDPIRFFKANDPYYFEVDNIPLKQLQENCNWLRDQVRNDTKLTGVKRADIDELRPYATGADRVIRVKPGRYSARINDASTKKPLAYLEKVMGDALGEVDAWSTTLPNPAGFTGLYKTGKNAIFQGALDTFKTAVASEAMGMTGLVERCFTWPIINSNTPIDNDGIKLVDGKTMSYGGPDVNIPGGGAEYSPMVISQALIWAKSQGATTADYALPSFEISNTNNGWAKLPRTESYFIKKWRGVSRIAIVDIVDELSIEVPGFDADDFSYTDSDGTTTPVTGVESRIDLVFIYSKPVDSASVLLLKPDGKQAITTPQLGIVRGAGIKTNYQETTNFEQDYIENMGSENKILAHPGDQKNIQMGFTSTSANDIAQDVRGTFPAPDDLINLAPLISEKLSDSAFELVGQSILPVAYVWVQNGSQVVLSTDVIDIRPLFRTAELAYNERAGIGAAFPQLSLANPAVGKGQLDYELKRVYDHLNGKVDNINSGLGGRNISTVAAGYVFGGYNFGPEGALFNFWRKEFGEDESLDNDSLQYIKAQVQSKYSYGTDIPTSLVEIPNYPDWDTAQWCIEQDLDDKGQYPNDYINTFLSQNWGKYNNGDDSIVAASNREGTNLGGLNKNGTEPLKLDRFDNVEAQGSNAHSNVYFHYISKKIFFDRPIWLMDYSVDVTLVNSLAQSETGYYGNDKGRDLAGSYFGHWIEKGPNYFIIYVAFTAETNSNDANPGFPGPNTKGVSQRDGGRYSGFVVPVSDLLSSNTNPMSIHGPAGGYVGNPRIGKCTYPTVMWKMTGIPDTDAAYLHGNLNGTNPEIKLKDI